MAFVTDLVKRGHALYDNNPYRYSTETQQYRDKLDEWFKDCKPFLNAVGEYAVPTQESIRFGVVPFSAIQHEIGLIINILTRSYGVDSEM